MKIAISSAGRGIESEIDVRFGRCPYFVIVEIENNKIKNEKTIENTAAQGMSAGITAAQIVANEGVSAVITKNMGPRAYNVMQQLGIKVYIASGKIKEAVQKFIEGKLEEMKVATGPRF